MRGSCLSPEASLRLDKFVPDEFVPPLPPLSNSNYLGYIFIYDCTLGLPVQARLSRVQCVSNHSVERFGMLMQNAIHVFI
ncbi:hypothetical protein SB6408_00090 [Klebsiella spallanzanii]|uniref:Uncharacterized protein n=1 Tax=Klebsiella spallanzanii TaxID=2587528 RepID=A0A564H403_9ENTR|nr:hypothetical protein SB6408_00090 [Klebsiella spallanzanii]